MGHYGIIYIARNDKHPENVYKIGGTSRNVAERMSELNRETGTFGRFQPKAFFPVNDWEQAEAACHLKLTQYREDKEFFMAPYDELVKIVRNICEQYPPSAYAPESLDETTTEPKPKVRAVGYKFLEELENGVMTQEQVNEAIALREAGDLDAYKAIKNQAEAQSKVIARNAITDAAKQRK